MLDWPVAVVLVAMTLGIVALGVTTVYLALQPRKQEQDTIGHLARLVAADGDVAQAARLEAVMAEQKFLDREVSEPVRPPRPVPVQ